MFSNKLRIWQGMLPMFLSLSISVVADPKPFHPDAKASEYYGGYKSVLVCEASEVFYLQKVENEFGVRHSFIVILKVIRTVKGKEAPGSRIACFTYHSEEKLELKGTYYLGFDDTAQKVFYLEPDNLCPIEKIGGRER